MGLGKEDGERTFKEGNKEWPGSQKIKDCSDDGAKLCSRLALV